MDPVQSFELHIPLTRILPLDMVVRAGFSMTLDCLHFIQNPVTTSAMPPSQDSIISTRLCRAKLQYYCYFVKNVVRGAYLQFL